MQAFDVVSDIALKDYPLYERIVTVTGDAVVDTANFAVRLGTNAQELIDAVGGFNIEDPGKIISGGPMMGKAMFSLDVPMVKGSSANCVKFT